MADDDDSTIWIDVAARLDERSADEVEGKLRGKFSHVGDSLKDSLAGAVKGLGSTIHDVLGDQLQDSLSGALSGREWDNLGKRAGPGDYVCRREPDRSCRAGAAR